MQSVAINSTPLRNCNNGEEDISHLFFSISVFDVIRKINTYKWPRALEACGIDWSRLEKLTFLIVFKSHIYA